MMGTALRWFLFVLLSPFYISTKWFDTFKGDWQKIN